MSRHLLILGANGMLGHDLQAVFGAEEGIKITAWDREDLDLTQQELVHENIRELAPDGIINAAAYTAVDQAEEEEKLAQAINGDAVGFIAEIAAELDSPVLHVSTDYVFDGTKQEGYAEDDPTNPQNAYGRTKLSGEQQLIEKHTKGYVIRTAWLFGHNGGNFVETMIKLGNEKDTLSVVHDQHGSPTFTKDLAEELLRLWKGSVSGDYAPGIYHVTNSGHTTWYGFAKAIFEHEGIEIDLSPCATEEFPRPAKRPAYSILNNTKLPELRSWQEALGDYLSSRR